VSINLTSAADIVSPNNTDPQFRSTNGDDLLVSSSPSQLNDLDVLNGALGFDTLVGRFTDNAAPTLSNIEKVELQSQNFGHTFNFANSTGIQEAFVKGDPDGFNDTTFKGLNLNWHVGVENFDNSLTGGTHTSEFIFSGANGTQTVELDLNKAGLFDATVENTNGNETDIVIDKIAGLNICVQGASNIILDSADSLTHINVFGNAGLRIDLDDSDTPLLTSVDAHGLNGFLVLDIGDEDFLGGAQTILVGTKGSIIEIDGEVADKITNGAGADLAIFNDATNVDTGVNISVTGVLDAQAIQILAFNPSQDAIDLSNTGAAGDGIYILTGAENAGTEAQASLRAAADLAIADANASSNNPEIAVFTYTVSGVDSTYVVLDNNNSNDLDNNDGLIKLVGVLGVTAADFIV
jgi:hypothetical protein